MTNTNLLKKRIEQSGLKIGFIAQMLKLSRSGLYKKINNQSFFNQHEIQMLCYILRIESDEEVRAIFFAEDVD